MSSASTLTKRDTLRRTDTDLALKTGRWRHIKRESRVEVGTFKTRTGPRVDVVQLNTENLVSHFIESYGHDIRFLLNSVTFA